MTLTATVSPAPDGGTVTFQSGGVDITGCSAQAVDPTSGEAVCTTSFAAGDHAIGANYSGNIDYASSMTASPTDLTVGSSAGGGPATTSVTLAAPDPASPTTGQSVILSATVSPVPDGGTTTSEQRAGHQRVLRPAGGP